MKVLCRFFGSIPIFAACLLIMLQPGFSQKTAAGTTPERTRQILTANAQELEARGRPDMAIQIWQQILLSDPRNPEALAGLARDYKLSGSNKQAEETLDKLRAIKPNDPNIAKIEALSSTKSQVDELRRAGDLARQGQNEQAMVIYRQIYGDHPPEGDVALAYYQTLYGTAAGKEHAIGAMRALVEKNPSDPRYAVELGRMLTYDPKTRPEGIRLLEAHPLDSNARVALRQALIWDSANPASATELRKFVEAHPEDAEIASRLKTNEAKLEQMNAGIARTPEERAAFAALNAHHLEDAEKRFTELLQQNPKNSRAAAGMGFLRMQQQNFRGAADYLSQAEKNGYKSSVVENALETARFWRTMGEASQALDADQPELAEQKYRDALAMRPRSMEALIGLAGLYTKEQQFQKAAATYEELLKREATNAEAWRGLFLAYAHDGQNQQALALLPRFPEPVKTELAKDPEYLRTLATVYEAEGRSADAQQVLSQALSMPFPDKGAHLKQETRLQYAGILMEARRFDQAAALYTQVLNENANSTPAWMGLVSAHHELGQDQKSIDDVEKMPPAVYESALSNTGFLWLLGGIYQQARQFDIAQSLLERSVKLEAAKGRQPDLQLQMQLAGVYLQRSNTAQAYAIYRQVLAAHPERADAWKGLIATLQATNHANEALQQLAFVPPVIRKELEKDLQFVATEAGIYASTGDLPHAVQSMSRVQRYFAQTGKTMPPDLAIQNAWLLYNTQNDRGLYPALMQLGSRSDLSVAQREAIQTIWGNWAVRRAGLAFENGASQRAVEILEAATQAFPDNLQVKRVLASGYLRTGQSRASLALYKSLPMEDAGANDYQGAIGAALAANDKSQAELWLRDALQRFPKDYHILAMAARYEQARGDMERSAGYWRAALAATPAGSPTDRLAHDLAYPEQNPRAQKARTAADLQQLLNPDSEPFQKTVKLPPLPAYGPDPYLGAAPVLISPRAETVAQQNEFPAAATPTTDIVVPAPAASPALPPISIATPAEQRITILSPPSDEQAQVYIPGIQSSNEDGGSGLARAAQHLAEPVKGEAGETEPSLDQKHETVRGDETNAGVTTASAVEKVRPVANAPLTLPGDTISDSRTASAVSVAERTLSGLQYTPSAQDSAGKQQGTARSTQDQQNQAAPMPVLPVTNAAAPRKPVHSRTRSSTKHHRAAQPVDMETVPTLATAPTENPAPETQAAPAERVQVPQETQQPPAPQDNTTPGGVTDEQLQERSLPPLRGPWVRVQRQPRVPSPREEAEQQLESLESSHSGWLGGTGMVNYRSGDLGYGRLAALEAPFESSTPFGYQMRLTFVAKPVFLDSGQADGSSVITVQEATSGSRTLVTIPQPLGTATNTGPTPGETFTGAPPGQQNASGLAGEVQLSSQTFSIAGGYTPYGFLVANWTARMQWRPGNGPLTLAFNRDSIKDSQLSYSGLRDPGTASLTYPGTIWGGVMATGGSIQYAHGDAQSGFYLGAAGQHISGYNVESNSRIDGNGGAYWQVKTLPEYGTLSVGTNFFAMHYSNNQDAFTFGLGGYFSPQAYFLTNVPLTWTGHSATRWHYEIAGGLGVQAFQQDLTPLFPLRAQKASEIALDNAALPAVTSVGGNYDIRARAAYQISPHWFAEGFAGGNNARNYNASSAGFSIHYMFRPQPSMIDAPTGLFPTEGLRPFTVP